MICWIWCILIRWDSPSDQATPWTAAGVHPRIDFRGEHCTALPAVPVLRIRCVDADKVLRVDQFACLDLPKLVCKAAYMVYGVGRCVVADVELNRSGKDQAVLSRRAQPQPLRQTAPRRTSQWLLLLRVQTTPATHDILTVLKAGKTMYQRLSENVVAKSTIS